MIHPIAAWALQPALVLGSDATSVPTRGSSDARRLPERVHGVQHPANGGEGASRTRLVTFDRSVATADLAARANGFWRSRLADSE